MEDACPLRLQADSSADEALLWQYDCGRCGMRFATKVPRGPAQERLLRCTQCRGRDFRKINMYILSDAFHGGR